jgi:hypothetical protein
MKKILISLIAFLCSFTLTINAQIPNPGFENWTSGNPDGWACSNVPVAGLVNVVESNDFHSGSHALRGEVVNFGGVPIAPIIQSGPGGTGFPVTEKYTSLELWYKFEPTGGDRFAVNVGMTKSGTPIAQAAVALPATVSDYTHLAVSLVYVTEDVPDAAIIQISINGPNSGTDLHVGSTMVIDDLLFSMLDGIGSSIMPSGEKCYPNPASDVLNIPIQGMELHELAVQVYDLLGHEIRTITGGKFNGVLQVPVKELPGGMYLYKVNTGAFPAAGKFTIVR